MPVLLTRPATAVARATAAALLDDGAEVRLFGPDAPAELRGRGAFVAAGDPDDHGLLEAALEQVHTLVHVGPGLAAASAEALEGEGRLVLEAAERAGVQRIVVLSLPGADPASDDPLRAAAGAVERAAAACTAPSVVVRVGLVDTPAARDRLASLPAGRLDDVVLAPVRVQDVAAGLLALDRARSRAHSGHVVFRAEGPQRLTVAEYLQQVGVRTPEGSTDLVGRVYRPGEATSHGRRALGASWDADTAATADLWGFAGVTPAPVSA